MKAQLNDKNEFMILLQDNTKCSIATKIRNAQLSGASLLILSYVDDNIQEAEVDLASFSGVTIPVILIKKSRADLLYTESIKLKTPMQISITYKKDQLIPDDANKLLIFMSSQPVKNPVIKFLADLRRHQNLIQGKELEIVFSVGFCTSCKDSGYLEKAERCLSGGKYCAINSIFKTDELVKETLRQICIRNYYGNNKLIMYLENLFVLADNEIESTDNMMEFDESRLNNLSETAMTITHINIKNIGECFADSFIKRSLNDNTRFGGRRKDIDIYFDDNSLLQKEQQRFLQITRFNIFPMIIIDDHLYDSRINLRTFIDFSCKRGFLNCKGYSAMKKMFLNSLVIVCSILLLSIIFICKKNIEKKLRYRMNFSYQRAMNKYYSLRGKDNESETLDQSTFFKYINFLLLL